MIKTLKNKIFKEHVSGLWVAMDGEMYVPKSGAHPAHFTFGCDIGNGYLRVGYKGEKYLVHRLVADCWIPNPDPKKLKTIDHYNRIRTDNSVDNLRWVNYSTQIQNRELPKNNAKSKKVYQYTLSGELVNIWPSRAECGRNGFDSSAVSKCCNGVYGKLGNVYKGYIWSYEPLN